MKIFCTFDENIFFLIVLNCDWFSGFCMNVIVLNVVTLILYIISISELVNNFCITYDTVTNTILYTIAIMLANLITILLYYYTTIIYTITNICHIDLY